MPHLEWTLNIGDVLMMGAGILSVIVAGAMRETFRSLESAVGKLTTAVDQLTSSSEEQRREIRRHRDWLIEINAKMDDPIRMERS